MCAVSADSWQIRLTPKRSDSQDLKHIQLECVFQTNVVSGKRFIVILFNTSNTCKYAGAFAQRMTIAETVFVTFVKSIAIDSCFPRAISCKSQNLI